MSKNRNQAAKAVKGSNKTNPTKNQFNFDACSSADQFVQQSLIYAKLAQSEEELTGDSIQEKIRSLCEPSVIQDNLDSVLNWLSILKINENIEKLVKLALQEDEHIQCILKPITICLQSTDMHICKRALRFVILLSEKFKQIRITQKTPVMETWFQNTYTILQTMLKKHQSIEKQVSQLVLSIYPILNDWYSVAANPVSPKELNFLFNISNNLHNFGRNELWKLLQDSDLAKDLTEGLNQNEDIKMRQACQKLLMQLYILDPDLISSVSKEPDASVQKKKKKRVVYNLKQSMIDAISAFGSLEDRQFKSQALLQSFFLLVKLTSDKEYKEAPIIYQSLVSILVEEYAAGDYEHINSMIAKFLTLLRRKQSKYSASLSILTLFEPFSDIIAKKNSLSDNEAQLLQEITLYGKFNAQIVNQSLRILSNIFHTQPSQSQRIHQAIVKIVTNFQQKLAVQNFLKQTIIPQQLNQIIAFKQEEVTKAGPNLDLSSVSDNNGSLENERKENDGKRTAIIQLVQAIFDLYKKSADDIESNFAPVNLKMCSSIQEMTKQSADKFKSSFKTESKELESLCNKVGVQRKMLLAQVKAGRESKQGLPNMLESINTDSHKHLRQQAPELKLSEDQNKTSSLLQSKQARVRRFQRGNLTSLGQHSDDEIDIALKKKSLERDSKTRSVLATANNSSQKPLKRTYQSDVRIKPASVAARNPIALINQNATSSKAQGKIKLVDFDQESPENKDKMKDIIVQNLELFKKLFERYQLKNPVDEEPTISTLATKQILREHRIEVASMTAVSLHTFVKKVNQKNSSEIEGGEKMNFEGFCEFLIQYSIYRCQQVKPESTENVPYDQMFETMIQSIKRTTEKPKKPLVKTEKILQSSEWNDNVLFVPQDKQARRIPTKQEPNPLKSMGLLYPANQKAYYDEVYPQLTIYRQENILKMQQLKKADSSLELPVPIEKLNTVKLEIPQANFKERRIQEQQLLKMNASPDIRAATFEYIMTQPLSEANNIKTCALVLEQLVQKVIHQADFSSFGPKMLINKRSINTNDAKNKKGTEPYDQKKVVLPSSPKMQVVKRSRIDLNVKGAYNDKGKSYDIYEQKGNRYNSIDGAAFAYQGITDGPEPEMYRIKNQTAKKQKQILQKALLPSIVVDDVHIVNKQRPELRSKESSTRELPSIDRPVSQINSQKHTPIKKRSKHLEAYTQIQKIETKQTNFIQSRANLMKMQKEEHVYQFGMPKDRSKISLEPLNAELKTIDDTYGHAQSKNYNELNEEQKLQLAKATIESEANQYENKYRVVMIAKSPMNVEIRNRRHQDFVDNNTDQENFERKNLKKQHMYKFFKYNELGSGGREVDMSDQIRAEIDKFINLNASKNTFALQDQSLKEAFYSSVRGSDQFPEPIVELRMNMDSFFRFVKRAGVLPKIVNRRQVRNAFQEQLAVQKTETLSYSQFLRAIVLLTTLAINAAEAVRISEQHARNRTNSLQAENEKEMKDFMSRMNIEFPDMPGKEMVPYIKFQSLKQKEKILKELEDEREQFKNQVQEEKYRQQLYLFKKISESFNIDNLTQSDLRKAFEFMVANWKKQENADKLEFPSQNVAIQDQGKNSYFRVYTTSNSINKIIPEIMPVPFGDLNTNGFIFNEELGKKIIHYTDMHFLNSAYLQFDGQDKEPITADFVELLVVHSPMQIRNVSAKDLEACITIYWGGKSKKQKPHGYGLAYAHKPQEGFDLIIYHGLFKFGSFLQGQTMKVKTNNQLSYWEGVYHKKEPQGYISLPEGTFTDANRLLTSFSTSSDKQFSRQQQSFGTQMKKLFNTEIKCADITKKRHVGEIMETHIPVNQETILVLDLTTRSQKLLHTKVDNSIRFFKSMILSVEENLVSAQNRGYSDQQLLDEWQRIMKAHGDSLTWKERDIFEKVIKEQISYIVDIERLKIVQMKVSRLITNYILHQPCDDNTSMLFGAIVIEFCQNIITNSPQKSIYALEAFAFAKNAYYRGANSTFDASDKRKLRFNLSWVQLMKDMGYTKQAYDLSKKVVEEARADFELKKQAQLPGESMSYEDEMAQLAANQEIEDMIAQFSQVMKALAKEIQLQMWGSTKLIMNCLNTPLEKRMRFQAVKPIKIGAKNKQRDL